MRKSLVEESSRIYDGNPDVLANVLNPEQVSIRNFVRHYSEEEQCGGGFRAEDWKWLGRTLIAAAELDAKIVLPEIAILIVDQGPPRPGRRGGTVHTFEFNEAVAKGIFEGGFKRLMQFFIEHKDIRCAQEGVEPFISCCRGYAQEAERESI